MNKLSQDLLDYMVTLGDKKRDLINLISPDPSKAFVYYIAPLSNIIRILNSGRILPRNEARDYVDLSADKIQTLRDRRIKIGAQNSKKEVRIHDCVNFFINPFNTTYYQFRRHALVRAVAGDPWSQFVCILEIDLASLLQDNSILWGISTNNVARTETQLLTERSAYGSLDWEKIYSLSLSLQQDKFNGSRSIEMIAYPHPDHSQKHIPASVIERILILKSDLDRSSLFESKDLQIQFSPFTSYQKYYVLDNPLYYDSRCLDSVSKVTKSFLSTNALIISLRRLLTFENEIGLELTKSYSDQNIARHGLHGVGHTIRVVLWILLLAEASKKAGVQISDEEKSAAVYAGFIHDLCRSNNGEEETHGRTASQVYKKFLTGFFSEQILDRCLKAIQVHSEETDPESPDIIWHLLKDADALDRGRFAAPGNAGGCDQKKLRLKILKDNQTFRRECLWFAYWLPRVTQYIDWKNNACKELVIALLASISMVINFEKPQPQVMEIAREICLKVPLTLFSFDEL